MRGVLILWAIGVGLFILVGAIMRAAPLSYEDERTGARMIILAIVWPLVIAWLTPGFIRRLFRDAEWSTDDRRY